MTWVNNVLDWVFMPEEEQDEDGFVAILASVRANREKMPPEVRDDLVLQFLIENTRDIRLIRKSNRAMRSRITFNLSAGVLIVVILFAHFISTGWLASLWLDIIR